MRVQVTPVRLVPSQRAKLLLTVFVADAIERQALAGLRPDGTPRPPGKTKPVIDLHDTGTLFATAEKSPGVITYRAEYARHVEAKHGFLGLTDEERRRVEALATEALRQETFGTK